MRLFIRAIRKARSKRRSIHAPNLTDELSTAEERRLNQFGSAGLVWCGQLWGAVCKFII